MSKINPNSPILKINHKLDSIVVNNGRIHIKLRYCGGTLWNSSRILRFGMITQRRIHIIKNHSICIKIRGEIKEQKLDRKSIAKRERYKIKSKIILIYNYKLQYNDTRWKIRRKTHNLTCDSAQMIQLVNGSKAFHFAISRTNVGIQEVNSPYFFDEISLSTILRYGNKPRRRKKRENQGWWCLNNLITKKHSIEEHSYK